MRKLWMVWPTMLLLGPIAAVLVLDRNTEAQSVRKPPVVEASRVVIRDAAGRMRGVIGITEDNESGLTFFDAKGKQRCRILVEADGSSRLALAGVDETPRVAALVGADGSASLGVDGDRGDLGLVATPAGDMALILSRAGKPRMVWGEDGRGRVLPGVMAPTSPGGSAPAGYRLTAPAP